MANLTEAAKMQIVQQWPEIINIDPIRVKTFQWILKNLEPNSATLLDLGAGPCIFARHARDAGFTVTAVDGRTERLPEASELEGITFVESDVRKFDVSGFDVISILGLLYHLTLADQVDLLQRCAYTNVVLETQVHFPEIVPPQARPWGYEIVHDGDYEGVLFPEGNNPMASIGNPTSFWHTESSILRLAENCGFQDVTVIEPLFVSKYGARKFYVLGGSDSAPAPRRTRQGFRGRLLRRHS